MKKDEALHIIEREIPKNPRTLADRLRAEAFVIAAAAVRNELIKENLQRLCFECKYKASCLNYKSGEWIACKEFKEE